MGANPVAEINETTYQWCVRALSFLHRRLGIHIKVHTVEDNFDSGQIFLFNHFARFETAIPQCIIYEATGAYCRSVAAGELFTGNDSLTKFLWSIGAVPTDHAGLLSFLAAEILRGRKVVIFPEGGMVKDRRVVDKKGRFSIYSPSAKTTRKHHKGASAIAVTLEIFKKRILTVNDAGDTERLERWVRALGLDSIDTLIDAVRQPTLVVPSNITFYPVRTDDNILRKGAELFNKDMAGAIKEELLIEGNILLKNTDMDVRFGRAVRPDITWSWWRLWILDRVFKRVDNLDDLFALQRESNRWMERLVSMAMVRQTRRLRDLCTTQMYSQVTVNLSHLASRLIIDLVDGGEMDISHRRFHKTLYLALKNAQNEPAIHLHRDLTNPEAYDGIHTGYCRRFDQFMHMATSSKLIDATAGRYRFLPKLQQEFGFDQVRLENMVAVYANEIAPVDGPCRAVKRAIKDGRGMDEAHMARLLFDDEIRAYHFGLRTYSKPKHTDINDQQTATESGQPYLLSPQTAKKQKPGKLGVVLIHGFLASPAELKAVGDKLAARGYPVMGVRLMGHGTSPWDLRDRSWEDWLASVRRGYEIISGLAERVCLVGFSAGGALALHLAAEQPEKLAGVAAICAPMKFRDRTLMFVPLIHGVNKLTRWLSSLEGVMPFHINDSEHQHINYRHIPMRGLFELRRMVDKLNRRLADVRCPVRVIQATEDPIVEAQSAEIIAAKVGSADKTVHMIESQRHGIVTDDIGGCQDLIVSLVESFCRAGPVSLPPLVAEPEAVGGAHARHAI